jgi:hypothetical protein
MLQSPPGLPNPKKLLYGSSLAQGISMVNFRPPPGLEHPTVDFEVPPGLEHPLDQFRGSKMFADASNADTEDTSAGSDAGHESSRAEDSNTEWSPRECLSNPSEVQPNKVKLSSDAAPFAPPIHASMAHRGPAAAIIKVWEVQGHKLVGSQGDWDVWCSVCQAHAKVQSFKLAQACPGCSQ